MRKSFCAIVMGLFAACGGSDEGGGEIVRLQQAVTVPDLTTGHWQLITLYNGECLTTRYGSPDAGHWFVNWPCSDNINQRVSFEDPDGDGWYRIKFQHSGLYITVPNNDPQEGWRHKQEQASSDPNDPSQLFQFRPVSADTFQLVTKNGLLLTMDVFDWVAYNQDDFLTQYRYATPAKTTFRLMRPGTPVNLTQGWHHFHTTPAFFEGVRQGPECLEVPYERMGDSHLWNWPCSQDKTSQQVKFEDAGDGWYRVRFRHSGGYLTVPSNSSANGWRLMQRAYTGGPEQKFRIERLEDGRIHFRTAQNRYLNMGYIDTNVISWPDFEDYDRFLMQHSELKSDDYNNSDFNLSFADHDVGTDFGYADRRWFMDYNGDGKLDYCRAIGSPSGAGSYLGCSFSVSEDSPSHIDVQVPIADWGYADRRWMVDFNGDGKTDFCRAVGTSSGGPQSYLGCSLSTPSGGFAGPLNLWVQIGDWGQVPERRFMADLNGI